MNYENEIITILNLHNTNKLNTYILNSNKFEIKKIIFYLIDKINNNITLKVIHTPINNYKLSYYYNLYEFILNNICLLFNESSDLDFNNTIINSIIESKLLNRLSTIYKGHYLLIKLDNIINILINQNYFEENIINVLYLESSIYGNVNIFLYWLENVSKKSIYTINYYILQSIILNSIKNSDDRLFKYLISNIFKKSNKDYLITNFSNDSKIHILYNNKDTIIKRIINEIAFIKTSDKIILKKIKFLSNYIDLIPYFNYMNIIVNNYDIIIKLHYYYYKTSYNFISMNNLLNNIINIINLKLYKNSTEKIIELFNILHTTEEKIILFIISNIVYNINVCFDCNYNKLKNIIINNIDEIYQLINWDTLINYSNNIFRNNILKIMIENNYVNNYIDKYNYINNKLLFFTRFYIYNCTNNKNYIKNNNIIKINKFLHYLRLCIKKRKLIKQVNYKLKMYKIHQDIIKFKKILYDNFNYSSLEYNSSNLINNNYYLLKENLNGLVINNLPNNINPYNKLLYDYTIYAKYIEELDVYFIYDINIPNTTMMERYNILKKIHNNIDTNINEINNFDEYIELIIKDKHIFNKFLINNKNKINWYPVFACKYLYNNNLINDIINFNHTNYDFLNSYYDGIQFYNLKIKPNISKIKYFLKLNTHFDINNFFIIKNPIFIYFYLKYINNEWVDNNNYNWNSNINLNIISNINIKNNNIYKFIIINNKFNIIDYIYYINQPSDTMFINNIFKNLIK